MWYLYTSLTELKHPAFFSAWDSISLWLTHDALRPEHMIEQLETGHLTVCLNAFFQVKKLVLCDQTELEMSQYATNVTKEDPIINDWWWTNVSMDTCLSGESRLVEQVQQEGQFYPHQQASNRAPMPGSTLVLHAGHAETWKLLPLHFFYCS